MDGRSPSYGPKHLVIPTVRVPDLFLLLIQFSHETFTSYFRLRSFALRDGAFHVGLNRSDPRQPFVDVTLVEVGD